MDRLEKLEKRWKELAGKPKNQEEIAETLSLAKEIELERAKEYSSMIMELKDKGIVISSVWDLVNTKSSYKVAIPILVNHLSKPYHIKNKEGIIRALAVKEAKGFACRAILDEYIKAPKSNSNYCWTFGNTMAIIMTPEYIDDVIAIVQDKTNGISRQMFVIALGKVKSEKAENVLINLLDDEELMPQTLEALGRMRSKKAKDKISTLINHPKALIRKEALKALKKIS